LLDKKIKWIDKEEVILIKAKRKKKKGNSYGNNKKRPDKSEEKYDQEKESYTNLEGTKLINRCTLDHRKKNSMERGGNGPLNSVLGSARV
jgi:hypothetical protein